MWQPGDVRILTASGVDLCVAPEDWAFARHHAAEIAQHWEKRARERPRFFNGVVHVLGSYSLSEAGQFSARLVRTDFASFLYWRESGWPDRQAMDAFGAALIQSPDGRVLVAEQRAGNLNEGLVYPPSGFIDPSDIGADGRVDIDASVRREVAEETGLDAAVLQAGGPYVIAMAGPVLAIGVRFRSRLSEDALLRRVAGHIAADAASELQRVRFIDAGSALAPLAMPEYARVLLSALGGLKTSP